MIICSYNDYIVGRNLFYIRDSNGSEIDFVLEKEGIVYLVEAKQAERPDQKSLNFKRFAPLFLQEVRTVLACNIHEKGMISFRDYSVYNPLNGLFSM